MLIEAQILLPVVGFLLACYLLALMVSVIAPWIISTKAVNKYVRKMIAGCVRLIGKFFNFLARIIEG